MSASDVVGRKELTSLALTAILFILIYRKGFVGGVTGVGRGIGHVGKTAGQGVLGMGKATTLGVLEVGKGVVGVGVGVGKTAGQVGKAAGGAVG